MKFRAHTVYLIIASLLVISSVASALDDFEVNPYGKFLSDSNGLLTIEMAIKDEKNASGLHDVVLLMRGYYAYEAGIDNQALLYTTRSASDGVDFKIKHHDHWLVRMMSRKGWGDWDDLQVNINGKNIQVYVDAEKSRTVQALHLVSAIGKEHMDEDLPVNPYGIFYRSHPTGLEIEMATLAKAGKNGLKDVILKISGAAAYDAGIDGKAIRYKAVPAGTGINYQYLKQGKWFTRMTQRDNFGWDTLKLFVGNETYSLSIDKKSLSRVYPLHLYSALAK